MTDFYSPAPGWYRNSQNQYQWWDGGSWGPTAPPMKHSCPDEPRKDIGTAYLLLLVLGSLGVHRFYTGQVGYGITFMILGLLTIVGLNLPGSASWVAIFFVPFTLLVILDLLLLGRSVRIVNQENGYIR